MALFPLGILSAAGAGGGAALSDYELIETQILGSSQANITFSNLNTYSSVYKHLQIRMALTSTVDSSIKFRLNGDTGTNYSFHALDGRGSTIVSFAFTSENAGFIGYSFAGVMSATLDLIDAYSTTTNKTTRALSGTTQSGNRVYLASSLRRSTESTTSITVLNEAGNFTVGSRFSIYGIR
jgi:hypothetical protein